MPTPTPAKSTTATFTFTKVRTEAGTVAFYEATPKDDGVDRPAIVFVHGAMRYAGVLMHWAEALEDIADIFFMELPGHGRSPPEGPSSVEGMGQLLYKVIETKLAGRKVLVVGESLGGAVALAAGGISRDGPIRAVFAADPPLSTAKLWHVHAAFHRSTPDDYPFGMRLAADSFGRIGEDNVEDRIYYPLIGRLCVPAVIATGDQPLFPPRAPQRTPCLLDSVDKFVVKSFYSDKAKLVEIPDCGHLLLADAPDACQEIIVGLLIQMAKSGEPVR